jgi:hypothetical protein
VPGRRAVAIAPQSTQGPLSSGTGGAGGAARRGRAWIGEGLLLGADRPDRHPWPACTPPAEEMQASPWATCCSAADGVGGDAPISRNEIRMTGKVHAQADPGFRGIIGVGSAAPTGYSGFASTAGVKPRPKTSMPSWSQSSPTAPCIKIMSRRAGRWCGHCVAAARKQNLSSKIGSGCWPWVCRGVRRLGCIR